MSGEEHYQAFGQLLYSVQTGKIAFDKLYGMPVFDFLQKHPEQAKIFDAAMVGVHGRETAAMLDAYDFSAIRVLADVGGGNGSVLTAVLKKHPRHARHPVRPTGLVERAKANIQASGVADRCLVIEGSFFKSVPNARCIPAPAHHPRLGRSCITILQNIGRAMGKDGRLLVVESVIPPGNDASFGKLLDLAMLAIPGGEERTEEEYRKLYQAAGFQSTRIVPTTAEVSVIEGALL